MVLFCLIFTYSCGEDKETIEFSESNELLEKEILRSDVRSLDQIDDPVFLDQYAKTEKYVKALISENNKDLKDYRINDLTLDQFEIVVVEKSQNTKTYHIQVFVPRNDGNEELTLRSWVTLNFESNENVFNQLQTGRLGDILLDFDSEGKTITASQNRYGYYSPKPANKPSKAPKAVICAHASSLIGLNGYCGFSVGYCSNDQGQCPPPQWVLDMIDAINSQKNTDDLTIPVRNGMDPNRNTFDMDFTTFSSNPFAIDTQLQSDFVLYYHQEYLGQGYYVNYNDKSEAHHIHKETFIRSFQDWLFVLEDHDPSVFYALVSNYITLRSVFWMFANIHLGAEMEDGVYMLRTTYASYANIPDLTCLTNRALFFQNDPQATTLIQQLNAGTITWQQFEAALPACN